MKNKLAFTALLLLMTANCYAQNTRALKGNYDPEWERLHTTWAEEKKKRN